METTISETKSHEHPEHGPNVEVTVDGVTKSVHRGHWIVSEFKQAVGVDPAKALDELIGGELKPLQDTDKVVIKGGEKFVSHARDGASS
jgi:hypothetical protein